MDWLFLDVRRKHGFAANHALLGLLFLSFWLPWLVDDSLLERYALRQIAWPGLLTHAFLHVHSLHLVWNLLLLAVFGSLASNELGSIRHGLAFLSFAVIAGMTHIMMDGDRAVGASGAVCGFVGMTLAANWRADLILFDGSIRFRVRSLAWILVGKDVLLLLMPEIHISVAGHAGGYLAGIAAGLLLRSARRMTDNSAERT